MPFSANGSLAMAFISNVAACSLSTCQAFLAAKDANTPLLNLPSETLLIELTADYLHAQLCKTALHAFAAENEARMEAMASARSQIERQLSALQATRRTVRQEEITAEIIELAAGETASRSGYARGCSASSLAN